MGAMTVGHNPIDRSKLGRTKRHILTDKNGIPRSAVISSASIHDIKLVTDVVDNRVVKRPPPPPYKTKKTGRRRLQHLCLDKAYNSESEEQELIKRGYVLHIPYKKKKEEEVDEENTKAMPNRKKHSPKRWVVERTFAWLGHFRRLSKDYEIAIKSAEARHLLVSAATSFIPAARSASRILG